MKTRTFILLFLCMGILVSCEAGGLDTVNVIPEPNYVRLLGGQSLSKECTRKDAIDSALGEEEYHIIIKDGNITVKASSARGFLYADQTLAQLPDESGYLPDVIIKDKPRFSYRGMHLDCGRHFFSIEEIKRYIDMMAVHKMNTFHWHLTEDQGWRVEIKKYPRLTDIGAWRYGNSLRNRTPKDSGRDLDLYGGYYTQDELRDVVSYASSKGIEVIPEIDLPGHMQAALAAYPEFGCTGGPYKVWNYTGISEEVLCPGKEATFRFLEDVLTEIMDIFPSKYIHIGGDECPRVRWEECPDCQARIAGIGLEDNGELTAEDGLQNYVTARICRFLEENGKTPIGWDEILEGEPAPGCVVMSWRGSEGGREAARLGHDAIMSPYSHMYLDYCQSMDRDSEPESIGGFLPVSKVYSYEPYTDEMTEREKSHILGVQANLWTEYISTAEHLEYMLLPRMSAVSEVQWCMPERKDKSRFMKDIERMIGIYEKMGYRYAQHIFEVDDEITVSGNSYNVALSTAGSAEIRYTLDGSEPDLSSSIYRDAITISSTPCTLKAAAFNKGTRTKTFTQEFIYNKAFGKPLTSSTPKAAGYGHLDIASLNDGLRGNMSYNTGRWTAWLGSPMDITIDMRNGDGSVPGYSSVTVGCMRYKRDGIFGPIGISIYTSEDGTAFEEAASIAIPVNDENVPEDIVDYKISFKETDAPFIRVVALDTRRIPEWHAGKGRNGYLFIDEIIVL